MSRIAAEATSASYPHDPPQTLLPLARLPAARQRRLPRLRGGRVPAGVAPGVRGAAGAAGDDRRPVTRDRRGRGGAAVARPRRPDASPVARHGGGLVLR